MKLTREEVEHLARLSRLKLTDADAEKYQTQLSEILGYMDILREVDTEGVEPTSQVTGLESVMGEDKVAACKNPEELLKCSPLPIVDDQIQVKNVF